MGAIIKKEFKTYFLSPIGYVVIGIFLLAFSASFYLNVLQYGSINFEYMFNSLPTILAIALIVPALTMRSFAEERKTGTEQILFTSPTSITKIVFGKFIAAVLIAIIIELCTVMYFAILCQFGMPHIQTALVTLLGVFLFMTTYIAFGILASSISENQIISIILTLAFFLATWLLPQFNSAFESISFINLLYKYTEGQIDIANTVTFITFTATCLLLSIIFIQRRKSIR